MKYQTFFKQIAFVLFVSFFASCDSDSNEIGANLVGNDNFAVEGQSFSVNATAFDYGAVASNNLPTAALGTYDNPVFGKTTANYATEVVLATVNPTIVADLTPTIDTVMLSVPYFSTATGVTDGAGHNTYTLDSIFGDKSAFLKLKVYRSRVFMSDVATPNFFTDQNSLFQTPESDLLGFNDNFSFDPSYQVEPTLNADTNTYSDTDVTPRMVLGLNKAKFQELLFGAAAQGQLLNNNIFKQYFRGIYFSAEQRDANKPVMGMLNFAAGKIIVKYTQKALAADEEPTVKKTIVLNMTGNSVSFPNKSGAATIPNAAQKLILEGGQGKMAVIELFPNGENVSLQAQKLLINDATLTFYVDTETMKDVANEPQRIYLYDLKNNTPIIDYYSDQTANSSKPKYGKTIHGGIIKVDSKGKGLQYTIRLTNHIINLLKDVNENPTESVKLGLVVTENINAVTTKPLKTPFTLPSGEKVENVPTMSVVHPFGTVLWGSGADVPADKRMKFQIYYTKPN